MLRHGAFDDACTAEPHSPAVLLEILRSRPQIHPRELPHIHQLLAELKVQIQEVTQTLQRLQQQWDEVTSISKVYQTLGAPIRRLPTELLAKIFVFCLPEAPWSYEVPEPTDVPIVAQVSHHWRCVALSTPKLWATMSFVVRAENGRRLRALAERWILRSGHHPIDLSIYVLGGGMGSIQIGPLPHVDASEFDALLDPEMLNHGSQLDRIRGCIPSLEELDVGRTVLHKAAYRTLALRRLVFHNTFEIAPRLRRPPMDQITSWHSREISVDMCIRRLTHTLNLTTASIDFEDFKSLTTQNLPSIPQLHFLTSLTINIPCSDNLSILLPALDLPALLQLSISTGHSEVAWPTDTIVLFLSRSPLLQKLSLYQLAMSSRDLAQVLLQTPSLNELISNIGTIFQRRAHLVPNLEALTFRGGIFFRDRELIPMIAHVDTTKALKLLHLDYDRDIRMEDIGSSLIGRLQSLEHQPGCNGPKIVIQRGSVDIGRFYSLPSQIIDLTAHYQFHSA
ncbi:hypothetical protein BD779DRAFT_1523997 [Infundibulicybe gibba]|nr:hypothetical protein BD779DRAFT_1523997 [Infundibulicybe gibba]